MRIQEALQPIHFKASLIEKKPDPEPFQFKGEDGKYYPTAGTLQDANRAWLDQTYRYKSPFTRREYSNPQTMYADEMAHLRDHIKPI